MAVALAVIGVAFGLACWRVGTRLALVLQPALDRKLTIAERLATVEERKIALEEAARTPRPKAAPMPADLRNRIASFEDEWARDDEERTLLMLYAETDDWELVRKQLRPIATANDPRTLDQPFVEEFPR